MSSRPKGSICRHTQRFTPSCVLFRWTEPTQWHGVRKPIALLYRNVSNKQFSQHEVLSLTADIVLCRMWGAVYVRKWVIWATRTWWLWRTFASMQSTILVEQSCGEGSLWHASHPSSNRYPRWLLASNRAIHDRLQSASSPVTTKAYEGNLNSLIYMY